MMTGVGLTHARVDVGDSKDIRILRVMGVVVGTAVKVVDEYSTDMITQCTTILRVIGFKTLYLHYHLIPIFTHRCKLLYLWIKMIFDTIHLSITLVWLVKRNYTQYL